MHYVMHYVKRHHASYHEYATIRHYNIIELYKVVSVKLLYFLNNFNSDCHVPFSHINY